MLFVWWGREAPGALLHWSVTPKMWCVILKRGRGLGLVTSARKGCDGAELPLRPQDRRQALTSR